MSAAARTNAAGHPCLWQKGKSARDLGTLGGDGGRAFAINDRSLIVGRTILRQIGRRNAFVWQDGTMTLLGALPGAKNSEAVAINNQGQIVGWSMTKTGARHAVLWTLRSG